MYVSPQRLSTHSHSGPFSNAPLHAHLNSTRSHHGPASIFTISADGNAAHKCIAIVLRRRRISTIGDGRHGRWRRIGHRCGRKARLVVNLEWSSCRRRRTRVGCWREGGIGWRCCHCSCKLCELSFVNEPICRSWRVRERRIRVSFWSERASERAAHVNIPTTQFNSIMLYKNHSILLFCS